MNELRFSGGARIGWSKVTSPLATLVVTSDTLELNAGMIGKVTLRAEEIESIEVHTFFPLISKGVKINHKVKQYNQRVIFWSTDRPETIIRQILESGFLSIED